MKKIPLVTALTAMTVFGFCDMQNQDLIADMQQNSNYNSSSNGSSSQSNATDEMYGFRLQGEALYWKTTLDDTGYTFVSSDSPAAVVYPYSDENKVSRFSWDWGFRLEAGYRFCDREWGLDVVYTQIHSQANNSVTAGAGQFLGTPLGITFDGTIKYGTTATNVFNNKFYIVDGLIERRYDVNSNIEFYPAFGVKGAWFRQTRSIDMTGGNFPADSVANWYVKNHFSGAGPKISLASKWIMGCGFSFYNKLGASLLLGNTELTESQTDSSSTANVVNMSQTSNRTIPVLEMLMGLEYLYTFEDVAQAIGFNVGFDAQYYFDEYVYLPTSPSAHYYSLGLYGISFGASWHF